MVQRRAEAQGKILSDEQIDDIAVVLRRKIDWEPIFSQIDESFVELLYQKESSITIFTHYSWSHDVLYCECREN